MKRLNLAKINCRPILKETEELEVVVEILWQRLFCELQVRLVSQLRRHFPDNPEALRLESRRENSNAYLTT